MILEIDSFEERLQKLNDVLNKELARMQEMTSR
jgi:hypothetical protein